MEDTTKYELETKKLPFKIIAVDQKQPDIDDIISN